ncbi:MAG TPA: hypothetical protein DFR83_11825, partial [Deltaproteobacteria bacterium]|nr:hypothetical protein [Deltaproteobacteria bacterium]
MVLGYAPRMPRPPIGFACLLFACGAESDDSRAKTATRPVSPQPDDTGAMGDAHDGAAGDDHTGTPGDTDAVGDWPELPELDAQLQQIMADAYIPGMSACIISDGAVVWCGAYGWANIEAGIPVETHTPFMLASVSKLFTATALMMAYDEGSFELDDPVAPVLDFPFAHPTDDTPITYRQLLSHAGGVRDNWDILNAYYADGDSPVPLRDFLADYYDPAGANYSERQNWVQSGVQTEMVYANMGYALIGHLVTRVTGQPFPDYCRSQIFEPLGMGQTAWFIGELDAATVAMPYGWRSGDYAAVGHYGYPDYPDGALRTGAEQLARFLAMSMRRGHIDGQTILESETFDEMVHPQYPALDATQGLGWYTWSLDGESLWGHGGSDVGVATQVAI